MPGYAAFYLASCVAAGIGYVLLAGVNPPGIAASPVIGASGAVAAVTGAYLSLFPRSEQRDHARPRTEPVADLRGKRADRAGVDVAVELLGHQRDAVCVLRLSGEGARRACIAAVRVRDFHGG